MIIEYYEEIGKHINDLYPKHIRAFEEHIQKHDIPREEIYNTIPEFVDTIPVSTKTRKTYRWALRNYIEIINEKKWKTGTYQNIEQSMGGQTRE